MELQNSENTELMEFKYYPTVKQLNFDKNKVIKIPFTDLATSGAVGAAMLPQFRQIVNTTSISGEGIYKCILPDGVTGAKLAYSKAKGMNIGAVLDANNKLAGQAAFQEVGNQTVKTITQLPIDPISISVAVSLAQINHKLDEIKQTQQDILKFLANDKKAKIEGSLQTLADINNKYFSIKDNAQLLNSYTNQVQSIKKECKDNCIFYRKQIQETLDKRKNDKIHISMTSKTLVESLTDDFRYYQMAIYTFAFAAYVELILNPTCSHQYVECTKQEISDIVIRYKTDYTLCYDIFDQYADKSIDKIAGKGIAKAIQLTGKGINQIPFVQDKKIGNKVAIPGEILDKNINSTIKQYKENLIKVKDPQVSEFTKQIQFLDDIYHSPTQIAFDNENLYMVTN